MDLTNPLFTVVVPLYNKGRAVADALASVQAQTCRDWEIVVVDDGSTDDSAAIACEFVERMSAQGHRAVVIRQVNAGAAAARNTAIDAARGALIAFLDADDEWQPWHLQSLQQLWSAFPTCGLFTAGWIKRTQAGQRSEPRHPSADSIAVNLFDGMRLRAVAPITSAVVVPLDIIRSVGAFDTRFRTGEDLDLWYRIGLKHSVAQSARPSAIVRQDREGVQHLTHAPAVDKGPGATNTLQARYLAGTISEDQRSPVRRFLVARRLRNALRMLVMERDRTQTRAALDQARGVWPGRGLPLFLALRLVTLVPGSGTMVGGTVALLRRPKREA